MIYKDIVLGRFIARPNRFVAHVEMEGKTEICHVKNTSRLQELLLPGATVSVQKRTGANRKTPYDLIAVEHGGIWVNIDSQAPNKLFGEWVLQSGYLGNLDLLRPETVYGKSRFDFYAEAGKRKIFVEVKGVTLVENGVARFPGAPTTRGTKHLRELAACAAEGYEAMVVFVVKRSDVRACAPNDDLDPAFGQALREAVAGGVKALALNCDVTPESLAVRGLADIIL